MIKGTIDRRPFYVWEAWYVMTKGIPLQEVADQLFVSPRIIRKWIALGYVTARRGKRGRILIYPSSYARLLSGGAYAEARSA